jgi:ABC-type transport system involved in multi-copper enzyme maturation permease subunit
LGICSEAADKGFRETKFVARPSDYDVMTTRHPSFMASPSPWTAWWSLIRLSVRRQARVQYMLWIAVTLMTMSILFVLSVTLLKGWKLTDYRPRSRAPTYRQTVENLEKERMLMARLEPAVAVHDAVIASAGAVLGHEYTAFQLFSRWIVFGIFQGFLLPLLTLSFATDALGQERENRTLIWLLTRPLPRPATYLAKYLAMLPWCLGLNLIAFAGICMAGGEPGRLALRLYWPAVLLGTLALAALFHLIAALFRRPAIVALIYSFFFETLVGDLPGDLKRGSLSFYIRSLMFDATHDMGLSPDQLTVYNPVSGSTATAVLLGVTVIFLVIGMCVFTRGEYCEDI